MVFVTSLSEKDAKKALEELNENPETRDEKIEGIFFLFLRFFNSSRTKTTLL